MLKTHDEAESRRNSEKVSEIFFDVGNPSKIYLTKVLVANKFIIFFISPGVLHRRP